MTEYKSKVKYEAPIEINIEEDFPDSGSMAVSEIENMIFSAVLKVGITVDKEELIKALRYDRGQYEKGYADGKRDAADAIEELEAEVKDLNEALKVESKARDNAEAKRYCCNCAHMDASMYDEAWYGICKLNDFEVEAIHGWGCTDWAKMEVQE